MGIQATINGSFFNHIPSFSYDIQLFHVLDVFPYYHLLSIIILQYRVPSFHVYWLSSLALQLSALHGPFAILCTLAAA
jgi:hypothetical protein